MSERSPIVSARGVVKRYGRVEALSPIDLDVHPGETVALLGPNGAGKTTLLSVLAGAVPASMGQVQRPSDDDTGWVPQRSAVYPKLTPRENLRLFARLERLPDPREASEQLLAAVGLMDAADRPTATLSVGNVQRLNVAIGLLGDPSVIFLDEPTASLDPTQRLILWDLLAAVARRGGAVVFATQNVEEAHLYATQLVVLLDGKLVFAGESERFWAQAGDAERAKGFEVAFVSIIARAGAAASPEAVAP